MWLSEKWRILEKWKCAGDKEKVFGTLLTDLSKTFDCLLHEVITKLHVYGGTFPALKLTLRQNCPYSEFFWSIFQYEFGIIQTRKTPNTDTFQRDSKEL